MCVLRVNVCCVYVVVVVRCCVLGGNVNVLLC